MCALHSTLSDLKVHEPSSLFPQLWPETQLGERKTGGVICNILEMAGTSLGGRGKRKQLRKICCVEGQRVISPTSFLP